ncbi:MAG: hypothetical protein SNJ75_03745 [Gemmataceae bacterium]
MIRPIFIVVCVVAVAGFAWWGLDGSVRWTKSDPVLTYPESVDLGELQEGEFALATFTVTNHRSDTVTITKFHAGCACISLFKKVDGNPISLAKETLAQGQSLEVNAQISIQGSSTGNLHHVLRMTTDCLDQPELSVSVVARVAYGFYPEAKEIALGEVTPGVAKQVAFRFVDARRPTTKGPIEIRSSSPMVRLREMEQVKPAADEESHPSWTHYQAVLEVNVPETTTEQRIQGQLEMFGGREKPMAVVHFAGFMKPKHILIPSSLIFREDKTNPPVEHSVLCRSREKTTLRPLSIPNGFLVQIRETADPLEQSIAIFRDPAKPLPQGLSRLTFEANTNGHTLPLELKVLVPAS